MFGKRECVSKKCSPGCWRVLGSLGTCHTVTRPLNWCQVDAGPAASHRRLEYEQIALRKLLIFVLKIYKSVKWQDGAMVAYLSGNPSRA